MTQCTKCGELFRRGQEELMCEQCYKALLRKINWTDRGRSVVTVGAIASCPGME